ncbi:MAG: arginine--tRNA ligase [Eubacterium sp.]|jgi:arginyl-tRNA synthetase|nr:arginine--tRNA ligase [Eubacterium sp.]
MAKDMASKAKSEINEIIMSALGNLTAEGKITSALPAFSVEIPADNTHGDFSCNAALVSAKALGLSPRELAGLIAGAMDLNETCFDRYEIAGPGFLNFFLDSKWYSSAVTAAIEQSDDFGRVNIGGGKKALIEFVSANPTGPMHIGNARGGALGDCLASLLEYAGYYVEREFYLNDAGNQIEKFGLSLDIRYRQGLGENVEMPEDSYHGDDITEHAKGFIKLYGEKYLSAPESERRKALIEYALPRNIDTLKSDLIKYRIEYNTWFRESSLYKENQTSKVVEKLKQNGFTYESDGAVWFKASDFGVEKDIVLVRQNGMPTYIVADIAYHYNKLITRGFDIAVDILGADHHGYKARMEAALKALNIDTQKLKIIICQMVRLVRGGETVKLSKRSGKAITLRTLLDEVPIDAARFFFNLRDSDTHLDFDLDLAIEESSKNPVYYVQYAYARICSVIRKLNVENKAYDPSVPVFFNEPSEFSLIRKISVFPSEVSLAASEFNPSRLTRYVFDLAGQFHKFYDGCRIIGESNEIINSRLALCIAARITIKNVLGILKVEAPEKM